MRILVHAINYSPELIGPAKYTTEMCEWLAARGHDVTVVVPPPYYPRWRVDPAYRQWSYSTSRENGVRVRRAPIWIPRKPGGIARVLHTLSFALSSLPVLLREALRSPQAVFVIEPSILGLPGAWLAARLAGARAWLHIQDFEIDVAYQLGQLSKGRKPVLAAERWLSRRFDVVSSISPQMTDRARAKGIARGEVFLLPNWVDPGTIFPMTPSSPFRERLSIPENAVVALFSGTLGAKQGIEMIVEAARRLAGAGVWFVICGDGVSAPSLHAAAEGLSNIRFLPLQPAAELNALLNLADIHLLPQRSGTAELFFPSKLIGMLASGRPVVAMSSPGSAIAQAIEGCGIRSDYDDVGAFAAAIQRLASNPDVRLELGRRARARALGRFRQDAILSNFESALAGEKHAVARVLVQTGD